MFMLVCVDVTVMSAAYVMSCVCVSVGWGMSDVYMLNKVGARTPRWGSFLNVVYCVL